MILICNTTASILLVSLILFDMYVHYLYGDVHENVSVDHWWCYLRAYFLHVGTSLLYHSYFLQAIFRFFRVVLYKHKHLQTLRFMCTLILIQWFIDFLCISPLLFLRYFQYIPQVYYCEILLTDTQGMLLMGVITYGIPMNGIGFIYGYILYYMRKRKSQLILQNRQQANQRDLTVLRRVMILLGMLFSLGLPTSILWGEYIFTGHANPIGYRLGWSLFTFSLSILPTISVLITPQLRELLLITCRRNRRIQPTITA